MASFLPSAGFSLAAGAGVGFAASGFTAGLSAGAGFAVLDVLGAAADGVWSFADGLLDWLVCHNESMAGKLAIGGVTTGGLIADKRELEKLDLVVC